MAPPEIADSFVFMDDEETSHHSRRYSQSHAVSSATETLTTPYHRGRSFSTSSIDPSTLAVQLISSVNNKLKEENEIPDDVEICEVTRALFLGAQRLLLIEELPKDRRENQYVLSGYRFYKSANDCLKSLFRLHNETMNIWSHLLGFIFFSFLSVNVFQVKKKNLMICYVCIYSYHIEEIP